MDSRHLSRQALPFFQLSNKKISIIHIITSGVQGNMLLIQCLNYLLENTLESHRTPAFRMCHQWEMQLHISRHLLDCDIVIFLKKIFNQQLLNAVCITNLPAPQSNCVLQIN